MTTYPSLLRPSDLDDDEQAFLVQALRRMSDEQLDAFDERLHELAREYDPPLGYIDDRSMQTLRMAALIHSGEAAPELTVLFFLAMCPLGQEQEHRSETMWNTRVEIEANGHEVYIDYDGVRHDREGAGWSAWCHCSGGSFDVRWGNDPHRYYATEDEARFAGSLHVDETGGAFHRPSDVG